MTNKFNTIFVAGLILSSTLLSMSNAVASDFAVMLKGGTTKIADEQQYLDGETRTFDTSSTKNYAVAWEVRNTKNVGLGMEYINYEHEYTSTSNDGYTNTQLLMFTARKFFDINNFIHPFCGIGLGWGYAKFHRADDVDRDWNPTLQFSGGVEFRLADGFGFFIEGKGFLPETDGDRSNDFDFSGPSLMGGISIIF